MSSESVSKILLTLEIKGKSKLSCELKRHLSPRAVGSITRSLPLEGNVHKLDNSIAYMETPIDAGIERKRTQFKKGDMAFLPNNGSICFFLNDVTEGKAMTPLGRIISDVASLNDLKSGDVFLLYAETG